MKIIELTADCDAEPLVSIVESHLESADSLDAVSTQLATELSEIGDNRHIFVGVGGEVTVAMIQLILKNADNDPDLANGDDIAHLHNLQVRADLQGQGIGRAMMNFVEDFARKIGKTTLTLGVDDVNERAHRLYEKRGYETFKTEPGRTPDEKCFCMWKKL